ncbi:MAG: transglycosylase SLT domain-containing protein, partial [Gemmatimonadales bacterium]
GPGFDWRLFKAQGIAESGLDSAATSPAGARGVMQLLPSTFQAIQSRNPELGSIDHPEWNIAAGINHDRSMWRLWRETATPRDRLGFMFASYNAGRTTILRAQDVARANQLDPKVWTSIAAVADKVGRWRHEETLGYLTKIEANYWRMVERGRASAAARH